MTFERSGPHPLLLVATVMVASSLEAGEARPLVPMTRFELDNGMEFLVVERPQAVTVSAGWVVAAGSANDPAGKTGLAHMLEHLMFKGSEAIRSGELDLLYAEAGAAGLNALTQRDLTAYFVNLPAEKLELWFWLESDRLLDPAFRELDSERQVVREERRLRVESTPTGELEEALQKRLWGNHAYGHPLSGHPVDLDRVKLDDVRRFFAEHYTPAKLTAVLSGGVDVERARELAERYFGRLPAAEVVDDRIAPPSDEISGGTVEATCTCRTQARILYRGVPFTHPDAAALDVLVSLLNGRSGRLHRSLVLDQGLAFAAFAQREGFRSAGYLTLTAEAKGQTDAPALLAALDVEIGRLVSGPPDEEEVARAKTRLLADSIRAVEEPSELMLQLLIHAGLGNADRLNTWQETLAGVSAEDVGRLARRVLVPEKRVVGLFGRIAPEHSAAGSG